MTSREGIERYVVETSKLYSLDYQGFFYVASGSPDDLDGYVQIYDNSQSYDWNISRISEFLGISEYDVRHANSKAQYVLFEKYNFFDLFSCYEKHKELSMYQHEKYDVESVENMVYAIFDVPLFEKRYDYQKVCERLISFLKETDKLIPGTYHDGATIQELIINAEHFYDFPHIKDLLESFFKLYDRMTELFFKGIECDLIQEEINEYNLMVSFLRARDICGTEMLHYNLLKKNRDIYKKESYSDIISYMKFSNSADFEPWKCKQMVEEKELLQKYQNIFPRTKNNINEFCRNIKNFKCNFFWSDDLDRVRQANENLPQWALDCGLDEIPEDVTVYVSKTDDELKTDYIFANKLSQLSSPEKMGGLVKRRPEYDRYNLEQYRSRMNFRYGTHWGCCKSADVDCISDKDDPECSEDDSYEG